MDCVERVIYPSPPYRILAHLKSFSLGTEPVPCIVRGNSCWRAYNGAAWKVDIKEKEKTMLRVKIYGKKW